MHGGTLYDEQEAKRNVEGVCAAMKKYGAPAYFFTWTCDQRQFPGVARVYNQIERLQLRYEYFAIYLLRVWDRVNRLFVRFLYESTEHPLGNVVHHFLRKEFQADVGNFYHCHFFWPGQLIG